MYANKVINQSQSIQRISLFGEGTSAAPASHRRDPDATKFTEHRAGYIYIYIHLYTPMYIYIYTPIAYNVYTVSL
jgi:hypothetical protein